MTNKEYQQWKKRIVQTGNRIVYNGKQHRQVAFPIGGIGTGSIALGAGGELKEWQIFNRVNKHASFPHSFFALWTKEDKKEPMAKRLQAKQWWFNGIEQVEFVGEYPIAEVKYTDSELPVEIKLNAYSPFVPQNAKDSGIPVAVFEFTVKNKTKKHVQISLVSTLQNAVGYTGFGPVIGVTYPTFGGNNNTAVQTDTYTAIHMTNEVLEPTSQLYGSMTLAVLEKNVQYLTHWDTLRTFWQAFSQSGILPSEPDMSPSKLGRTWNGAIAVQRKLTPNESCSITFLISWHFPNRYVDFWEENTQYRIGNMYNHWFNDSLAVTDYVVQNFVRLRNTTFTFRDTFYNSTLPYYILDCITSQISTLRSQTLLWLEDGTVAGFEGCGADRGCCPMNCTHVWNYVQTMAYLFPELERNMRHTDLTGIMQPNGMIPHRTNIPTYLPHTERDAIDGQAGEILKVYREYLMSPDRQFLDEHWQQLKQAMNYLTEICDAKKQGLLEGEQWNTYDLSLYGANSFIGSLYLAALRAMEEMAKIQNEPELAAKYQSLFTQGTKLLDTMLWNGEYYVQNVDSKQYPKLQYGKGCLSDQVVGQWWAHMLNLGYILPAEHIKKTLQSIFKYNWRKDLTDFEHTQRVFAEGHEAGLINCTWPKGGRSKEPILYCDEVWTGVEYQVAAHMIYEGFIKLGLQIVKAARERYNGIKRNPWNEIECGDHYARAMSSWSLLLALSGFIHNGSEKMLGFNPRITPENFKSFYATATAWGTFSQKRTNRIQLNEITVASGNLVLHELRLGILNSVKKNIKRVEIVQKNQSIHITWTQSDNSLLTITIKPAISIGEGDSIKITVYW
ncbi:MAG: GH116 family glycosyl-hydrolase [bacterium]|nr:GH116 family glycosyl-hydrolase [bacterium]